MAEENKLIQQIQPPPPLFLGQKEKDLVKQINDELIEKIIGQQVLYYPIDVESTNYHPVYGEAVQKNYFPSIRVYVLIEWEGYETQNKPFLERRTKLKVHFHKRRLTEDQDLYVRAGDYIQYGEDFFEIVSLDEPRELFGQNKSKVEIVANCVYSREGVFDSE
jgi:hypothetical protein